MERSLSAVADTASMNQTQGADVSSLVEKGFVFKTDTFAKLFLLIQKYLSLAIFTFFLFVSFFHLSLSIPPIALSFESIRISSTYFVSLGVLSYLIFKAKKCSMSLVGLMTAVIAVELAVFSIPHSIVMYGVLAFGLSLFFEAVQHREIQKAPQQVCEKVSNIPVETHIELEKKYTELFEKETLFKSLLADFETAKKTHQQEVLSLQSALQDASSELRQAKTLYDSLKITLEATKKTACVQKASQEAYKELEKQYLHAQAKYEQLQDQFYEQKNVLNEARKELFIVQGREIALSNKLREYENSSLYGSLHEITFAFEATAGEEQKNLHVVDDREYESIIASHEEIIRSLLVENEALRAKKG